MIPHVRASDRRDRYTTNFNQLNSNAWENVEETVAATTYMSWAIN